MWNMAQKWKPQLQSIVGSFVLHGVSTGIAVDTSIEYRPRRRSICQPTIGRPIDGRHSTAAVYRRIVDRCLVVPLARYHRRNTNTPLTYHRLLSCKSRSTPRSIAASSECLETFHCRSVFFQWSLKVTLSTQPSWGYKITLQCCDKVLITEKNY